MNCRRLALILSLVASSFIPVLAQNLDADLQRAKQREAATGDCKVLLSEYGRITALGAKSNRAAAAEALLRTGLCHEREGRAADAKDAYLQVTREYGDQTAAVAEARARLAAVTTPVQGGDAETQRLVWTLGADDRIVGPVSQDGRFVAFSTDGREGKELVLRDLRSGTNRTVARGTKEEPLFAVYSAAFSRNGGSLAYEAAYETSPRVFTAQLRVIDLAAPGLPRPRVLIEAATNSRGGVGRRGQFRDADAGSPLDWSPDGKSIVVSRRLNPATQEITLVSAIDGARLRILKSVPWRGSHLRGFLSPDGTLLAIEMFEAGRADRDIVVLALDGTIEIPAVTSAGDDSLMGWSPDGRSIVFISARTGSSALWTQRTDGGRVIGPAEPLRRGFGPANSLGLTTSGALYSILATGLESTIKEAVFDFATGTFASPPRDAAQTFVRSNYGPRWSPDGKHLGYFSKRAENGPSVLVIRTLETGESREQAIDFLFVGNNPRYWDWMPDGRSIMALGENYEGRYGIHRIDLATGQVAPLALDPALTVLPELAPDGRTVYYTRQTRVAPAPGQTAPFVRVARDLATGDEREEPAVVRSRDGIKTYDARVIAGGQVIVERNTTSGMEREVLRLSGRYGWRLTADGGAIVAGTIDQSTKEGQVILCSLENGSVKTIFRAAPGQQVAVHGFVPDEQATLAFEVNGRSGVWWWVPFDGRPARQLRELDGVIIATGGRPSFQFHPDGRRLAFEVRNPAPSADQVFVLEKFLPPLGGRGAGGR